MRQTPIRIAMIVLPLALAACGDGREQPAPSPSPAASPSDEPTVSIIRPDVAPTPAADLPPAPLAATVGFPGGGTALDEAARGALDEVLASDQLAEGWPVVLRGHGDSAGHDADNIVVSRRRAEAVARYLVEHGVDEARIAVIALGEQNPVAPNAHPGGTPDEQGRARNRRVEVTIAAPEKPPEPDSAATAGPAAALDAAPD